MLSETETKDLLRDVMLEIKKAGPRSNMNWKLGTANALQAVLQMNEKEAMELTEESF